MDGARKARRANYLRAMWSGALSRAVAMLVQLVTVGLTVRYLGKERFGMWATISTVMAWLSIGNFGLGNGLQTRLSHLTGADDAVSAQRAISSSLAIITASSAFVLGGVIAAGVLIPWDHVFGVSSALAVAEARPTVIVVLVSMTLLLPVSLSGSILQGHQRIDMVNLVGAGAALSGLVGLVIATRLEAGMPILGLVLVGPGIVASLIQFVIARRLGYLRFSFQSIHVGEAWRMLSLGWKFLGLQLVVIVMFQSGAIIIAQKFGSEEVTPYAVTGRVVSIVLVFLTVVLAPLWPAYGEAFGRGDMDWVRRVFRKSLRLVLLICVPMMVFLLVCGQWMIRLWAGTEGVPGFWLLFSMMAFLLAQCIAMCASYLLNGVGTLGSQLIAGALQSVLFIPVALLLCPRFGVAAVPMAQAGLMVICFIPITFWQCHRIIARGPATTSEAKASVAEK
jgi:O-antigen/teichoic acid export membrane protein